MHENLMCGCGTGREAMQSATRPSTHPRPNGSVRNQIDAAMTYAGTDFANVLNPFT